jgi:hypothetical protein
MDRGAGMHLEGELQLRGGGRGSRVFVPCSIETAKAICYLPTSSSGA